MRLRDSVISSGAISLSLISTLMLASSLGGAWDGDTSHSFDSRLLDLSGAICFSGNRLIIIEVSREE
jgi:hypothetical protein